MFDTSDTLFLKKVKSFTMLPSSSSSSHHVGGGLSIDESSRSSIGSSNRIGSSNNGGGGSGSRHLLSRVPEVGVVAGELQFMLNSAVNLATLQIDKNAIKDQTEDQATVLVLPQPIALRPTLSPFLSRSGIIFAGDLYNTDDIQSLLWYIH